MVCTTLLTTSVDESFSRAAPSNGPDNLPLYVANSINPRRPIQSKVSSLAKRWNLTRGTSDKKYDLETLKISALHCSTKESYLKSTGFIARNSIQGRYPYLNHWSINFCAELPVIPTITVSQRGGFCFRLQKNRYNNASCRTYRACYPKTLKTQFLVTVLTP